MQDHRVRGGSQSLVCPREEATSNPKQLIRGFPSSRILVHTQGISELSRPVWRRNFLGPYGLPTVRS